MSREAIGLLETTGFTPAAVALDRMDKAARIRVLQLELNDRLGVVVKVAGELAAVNAALAAGRGVAEELGGSPVTRVLPQSPPGMSDVLLPGVEYNGLIEQDVVQLPQERIETHEEIAMPETPVAALGFVETQGFTAVFAAIDTACKAANVEVVGKEKLGGGYVTVIVKGDVAAVTAAIEAARGQVADLGVLIAAHVVTRPSPSVLRLLPTV